MRERSLPAINMDGAPHNEQAAIWLADIAYNNAVITRAMDNNDISLLSYDKLKHVSMAFHLFAELLNYADYNYGWRHINQDVVLETRRTLLIKKLNNFRKTATICNNSHYSHL